MEKADTQFPCHDSIVPTNSQKQRRCKLPIHFWADEGTIEIVFRTIISFNQLSIYGAVSDLCEEYSSCQTRTRRLVLAGQSDPLFLLTSSLMKTPTPSTDDLAREDLLQKYQERVERPSQQNRVIKICIDAGFLTTVDVGQYFMTKHTDEFLEFAEPVTCREYILPRVDKSSDPKGWIRGNTKIVPVLEVTTSYLQGKYGLEIRIESVNKDHSHSWVRISHGMNKLVTDLTNKEDDNEQETSCPRSPKVHEQMDEPAPNQQGERQQRAGNFCDEVGRIRVDHECTCFCEPIKGSSKTTKTYSCLLIYKNCTCR